METNENEKINIWEIPDWKPEHEVNYEDIEGEYEFNYRMKYECVFFLKRVETETELEELVEAFAWSHELKVPRSFRDNTPKDLDMIWGKLYSLATDIPWECRWKLKDYQNCIKNDLIFKLRLFLDLVKVNKNPFDPEPLSERKKRQIADFKNQFPSLFEKLNTEYVEVFPYSS